MMVREFIAFFIGVVLTLCCFPLLHSRLVKRYLRLRGKFEQARKLFNSQTERHEELFTMAHNNIDELQDVRPYFPKDE